LAILFLPPSFSFKAQKNDFAIIPNAGVALGVLSSYAGLHV
jgi:hypothetical protein